MYTLTNNPAEATHAITNNGETITVKKMRTGEAGGAFGDDITAKEGLVATVEYFINVERPQHIPSLMMLSYTLGEGRHYITA